MREFKPILPGTDNNNKNDRPVNAVYKDPATGLYRNEILHIGVKKPIPFFNEQIKYNNKVQLGASGEFLLNNFSVNQSGEERLGRTFTNFMKELGAGVMYTAAGTLELGRDIITLDIINKIFGKNYKKPEGSRKLQTESLNSRIKSKR